MRVVGKAGGKCEVRLVPTPTLLTAGKRCILRHALRRLKIWSWKRVLWEVARGGGGQRERHE
eukprot:15396008-Alexandrium_andersonii.AAC.1